jgi:hypothetical protein
MNEDVSVPVGPCAKSRKTAAHLGCTVKRTGEPSEGGTRGKR